MRIVCPDCKKRVAPRYHLHQGKLGAGDAREFYATEGGQPWASFWTQADGERWVRERSIEGHKKAGECDPSSDGSAATSDG